MRFNQVSFHEYEKMRIVPEMTVISIGPEDLVLATTVRVPIEAGEFILGVGLEVVEAFPGVADIDVGIDGDADHYHLALSPLNLEWHFTNLPEKFNVADYVDVAFNAALPGFVDRGLAKLFIYRFRTEGTWRQPDL
jgi:hypothetical protein